jgi:uncharacterized protein
MLVDFEVENFRSYREAKRLSMVASSAKELPNNLIDTEPGLKLVRSAVLYGPNASGKSNLLRAMNWVSAFLEFPTNRAWTADIRQLPFALDRISASKPTRFRVRFLVEGVLYDYAISVQPETVEEERLVVYPHGRPQEWFHRRGKDVEFNATYLKGQKQSLRGMTPAVAPLLAVGAAFGHPQLTSPARWLVNNLREGFQSLGFRIRAGSLSAAGPVEITALRCHEDHSFRSWVNALLRHADLGIRGVEIELLTHRHSEPMVTRAPDGRSITSSQEWNEERPELFLVHGSDEGIPIRFKFEDESRGTRRLFLMLVPLYEILQAGELAVDDELDTSLHPCLVREIIRAFHDPELNPKGAQLVFATHDTSLLSGQLFRRDQIWFTEKDAGGATDLYSLNDIKGVREDESFEKGYLRGRYGAIPFFGSFDFPPVSEEPAEAVT